MIGFLYLFLSILCSVIILVTFKMAERYQIRIFYPIVLNYFMGFFLGLTINTVSFEHVMDNDKTWIIFSGLIGAAFISMFYLIGMSSQKAGIAATSVASKMSVIVPMSFAIIYYSEEVNALKITGILLAVAAVVLTSYKKTSEKIERNYLFLPIIIFIGSGIIDVLVEFSQREFVNNETNAMFSLTIFAVAALIGTTISIVRRIPLHNFLSPKVLISGTILGFSNFGTVYFIILALKSELIDDSIVFGLNNVGVVTLSVFVAVLFLNEKITRINRFGILLAFVSAYLLLNY